MNTLLEEISEFIQKGRATKVIELVDKAINEGIDSKIILEDGLLKGMNIIGVKFKNNEVFVPEVLIAARAMNMGIGVIKPYLVNSGVEPAGTAIIGTVKGDMHDIGKNLVKMMLESKGLNVIDIGVDIPAEKFVDKALENNAKVVCCSALLTTTMTELKNIVDEFTARNVRDQFKIMVGGAPVTEEFANSIGADKYAPDASTASEVALELCRV